MSEDCIYCGESTAMGDGNYHEECYNEKKHGERAW